MLDYFGMRKEAALYVINKRVTGEQWTNRGPAEEYGEGKELYYLGAGYWRALVNTEARTINLINPDKTGEQITRVEKGLAVLLPALIYKDENQGREWVEVDREELDQLRKLVNELGAAIKLLREG
jgi:hypothetical protein